MSNYLGDVLLDISSIQSNLEDRNITDETIESIAQNMVLTRGTVQPLVVRKAGYDENGEEVYGLVHGQLEYRAAQRAMALDPTFEMVRAFVIEIDRDEAVLRQIELLGNQIPEPLPDKPPASEDKSATVAELEKILSSVQKIQKRVHQDYQNLVNDIQKLLPPPPPDQRIIFLNKFLAQSDPKEIQTKLSFLKNSKLVTTIIDSHPYNSLEDLQRVKGVGKGATLTKLLKWLDEQA